MEEWRRVTGVLSAECVCSDFTPWTGRMSARLADSVDRYREAERDLDRSRARAMNEEREWLGDDHVDEVDEIASSVVEWPSVPIGPSSEWSGNERGVGGGGREESNADSAESP